MMMSHMADITIYTDGGARGNPGPAGAGAVAFQNNETVFELKKFLGARQTNNWAEYEAVALALEELVRRKQSNRSLEIRMDSKLVVEQMSGNWKIKEENLKEQAAKTRALLREHFPNYRFVYVPREQNKIADRLVNEAIDEGV